MDRIIIRINNQDVGPGFLVAPNEQMTLKVYTENYTSLKENNKKKQNISKAKEKYIRYLLKVGFTDEYIIEKTKITAKQLKKIKQNK